MRAWWQRDGDSRPIMAGDGPTPLRRCFRAALNTGMAALLLVTGCSGLFFYPSRVMQPNVAAAVLAPRDVYFRTSDGLMLHGLFFQADRPQGTILALHGNAENLSTHVNGVLWLVLKQFNLFMFDYRGYGLSEGSPTIEGVHRDAEAALSALLSLPSVDSDRVVVLGQSIGGAIAVNLVATSSRKPHIRALIVDSAFASYRLIAREKMGQLCLTWPVHYPASLLFDDSFSPLSRIGDVAPVPVLILHGTSDPVVPLHHGEQLYHAARAPKQFWKTTPEGHVRSLSDELVREQFVAYLQRCLSQVAPSTTSSE